MRDNYSDHSLFETVRCRQKWNCTKITQITPLSDAIVNTHRVLKYDKSSKSLPLAKISSQGGLETINQILTFHECRVLRTAFQRHERNLNKKMLKLNCTKKYIMTS